MGRTRAGFAGRGRGGELACALVQVSLRIGAVQPVPALGGGGLMALSALLDGVRPRCRSLAVAQALGSALAQAHQRPCG
ncbi:hypothetical protein CCO03_00950 [Comamonas serinivorans]|uniref:Uncharacterized protein n=1 Tax=Comamonas serinivorans TaxID=1082851 RepID=A0A1Y0EIN4_9BURK|nr:hypothetical protein CCO03_00950 [Comamonas serinivorans]